LSRRDAARVARTAAAVICAAVGLGVAATQAVAAIGDPPPPPANVVTLADDDAEMAMFAVSDLAGGRSVSRCLQVTYEGEGPAILRLYGSAAGTGLAPYLNLRVEQGSGGGFDSCAGFAGSVVYTGTLAQFAAMHADFASGVTLPAQPDPAPLTYRFTATVANAAAAQGRDATADFWWEAQTVDVPPATPPVTTPPVSPDASAPPSGEPPTVEAAPPAPAATDSPAPVAVPSAAATPGSAVTVTNAPAIPSQAVRMAAGERVELVPGVPGRGAPKPRAATRSLLGRTASVVAGATRQAAFPGLMLVLALLFLLVQDRIDRHDPKLALAPVHADPDLPFQ
jgi:hypothetical protein